MEYPGSWFVAGATSNLGIVLADSASPVFRLQVQLASSNPSPQKLRSSAKERREVPQHSIDPVKEKHIANWMQLDGDDPVIVTAQSNMRKCSSRGCAYKMSHRGSGHDTHSSRWQQIACLSGNHVCRRCTFHPSCSINVYGSSCRMLWASFRLLVCISTGSLGRASAPFASEEAR